MRKILPIILLVSLPGLLLAQKDRWHVFHRTTALAYPNYPSQNLGVEYFPLPGDFSITGEIGFIGAGSLSDEPFVKSRKHYGELRQYVKKGEDRLVFIGVSYQYRNTQIEDTYVLGFDCLGFQSRDCERYMEYTGPLTSRYHEAQLILGAKSFISDWFYYDAFLGIGVGDHRLDRSQINDGSLVERGRFWQENSFGPNRFQLNVTVKLGLVLDRIFSKGEEQRTPKGD